MVYNDCTDVLAIDLGTSNTTAWFINKNGNFVLVTFDNGDNVCPSVVLYRDNGDVLVGHSAERFIGVENGLVHSSKRVIGRAFNDSLVQSFLKSCGSKIVDQNGRVAFDIGNNRFVTPRQVATEIIKHVIAKATIQQPSGFRKCVVTVPVVFTQDQRLETKKAAEEAGLEVLNIFTEPSCAAFGYAYTHQHLRNGKFFVYDLGGGTFDACLAEFDQLRFNPISSLGNDSIGGGNFDTSIYQYVENNYIEKYSPEIFPDTKSGERQKNKLRKDCRIAKEQIGNGSMRETVVIEENEKNGTKYFTQEIFPVLLDNIITSPVSDTRSITLQVMKGVEPTSVDKVILVGGSTKITSIPQMLATIFPSDRIVPTSEVDPMTCVSKGALLQIIALINKEVSDEELSTHSLLIDGQSVGTIHVRPTIIERLTVSVGTNKRKQSTKKDEMEIMIPIGTQLPHSFTRNFYLDPGQTETVDTIYQGEFIQELNKNKNLGSFRITGFPGISEQITVRWTMEMNTSQILFVTVEEVYQNNKRVMVEKQEYDTRGGNMGANGAEKVFNNRTVIPNGAILLTDQQRNTIRGLVDDGDNLAEMTMIPVSPPPSQQQQPQSVLTHVKSEIIPVPQPIVQRVRDPSPQPVIRREESIPAPQPTQHIYSNHQYVSSPSRKSSDEGVKRTAKSCCSVM